MKRTLFMTSRVTVLAMCAAVHAQASGGGDDVPPDVTAGADESVQVAEEPRQITMVRTEDPPVIDGKLDDAAWANAALIDAFFQIEPIEGAPPSERTEARLLYDTNYLYIGIRCFDSDPSGIRATGMQRDRGLEADDRISIVIDPYYERRNGFFFQMNPAGSKLDGLIENNTNVRSDWDGIWYGKSTIDEQGWSAEIAIPFQTLSFNPDTTKWGFNVARFIRRKNEEIRWSGISQNKRMRSLSDAGVLEEIHDIKQGVGVDVKPYSTMRFLPDADSVEFDAGADVFYHITPSLTLAATLNTDFAETEVDERRVNLTRFPLFFPEKRDFFLQDADVFAFGGIRRNPLPFQSRRIGLGPGGIPIDLYGGVRLTGHTGKWNIGFLDVQAKGFGGLDSKNLAVGRVSYNILEESSIGAIFTAGDPRTNGDNYLVGADFKYRNSKVNGDQIFETQWWAMRTFSSGVDGHEAAYGGRVSWPNDRIDAGVGMFYLGENLKPALGFASRVGVREYFGDFRYRWRPQTWIRTIDTGFRGMLVTQMDNTLETAELTVNLLEIELESGDQLELEYEYGKEVLTEPFDIRDDITIPAGSYRTNRFQAEIATSRARPIAGRVNVGVGDFFSGTRVATSVGVEWRPSRYFFLGGEIENNAIDLAEGSFTTDLARARINVQFSPELSWNTFAQYDSDSDSIGINSRVRWIVKPGSEVNIVINQTLDLIDSHVERGDTELVGKVSWTFRY